MEIDHHRSWNQKCEPDNKNQILNKNKPTTEILTNISKYNLKAIYKRLPHSPPCFMYPRLWLADLMITLTTVGNPKVFSLYLMVLYYS